MNVVVFSKKPASSRTKFPRRPRTGPEVEVYPTVQLRRVLPGLAAGTLVYLDLGGLGEVERRRWLALLLKRRDILHGVIDPQGKEPDVAGLFHAGAVDYIGREFRSTSLSAKRVQRVLAWARATGRGGSCPPEAATLSTEGWDSVVQGRPHDFAFLFVEVDSVDAMKRRHGAENLAAVMDSFRSYIERMVSPHDGRLWTWAAFGGLILFPLPQKAAAGDPLASGSPVLCGLRIGLSRVLYDAEESPLPAILSFRMALSRGSIVYKERDTGSVIAESLNAIFHLGQKFAKPGQFVMAEDALDLVPQRLRSIIQPAGVFEGKKVHRVLTPRYPPLPKESEWLAGE